MIVLGWISTFCLSMCGMPLAINAYKRGHADSVDPTFLCLWFIGELFGFIYTLSLRDIPLIANYGFNLALILIVIKYKLEPRE